MMTELRLSLLARVARRFTSLTAKATWRELPVFSFETEPELHRGGCGTGGLDARTPVGPVGC